MGRLIKQFPDGSHLEYDRGSFDEWCVYLVDNKGIRKPPRDTDYFSELKNFADKYGTDKIYNDYVKVYEMTEKEVNDEVLIEITKISEKYGDDVIQIDTIFSILYMAMIAEERKVGTRLGKRIKRIGIYKLLIEDKPVYEAANFMRGMKWREIDSLCRERGF